MFKEVMSANFSRSVNAKVSLNFVSEWTQALNGNAPISVVLDQLMKLLNADAALIARTATASQKARHIARRCIQEGKIWPSQPMALAGLVLGDCLSTAKAGSVWKLSDTSIRHDRSDPGFRYQMPIELEEALVVPLESRRGDIDHLELHYRQRPNTQDLDLLVVMASTLASSWHKRVPGLMFANSKLAVQHSIGDCRDEGCIPILDPRNPAELSRCEFRVCAMMKEGMTVKLISDTLSVGPATVRSHLSSIYSKTGASNQIELLHLLNKNFAPEFKVIGSAG
ncbi:MAG: LuxR C-terminal-related transcriptional regulator [Ruegeria sp.]